MRDGYDARRFRDYNFLDAPSCRGRFDALGEPFQQRFARGGSEAVSLERAQNCSMNFQASAGTQLVVCPGSLGDG